MATTIERTTAILPQSIASVPALAQAATLLVARSLCQHFALPHPSTESILAATGCSRSRAYGLMTPLAALLPTLLRPVGRPGCAPLPTPTGPDVSTITLEVLRYVVQHPGCAHSHDKRQLYSDGLRHFILALRSKHSELSTETFAALVCVPVGTLKAWLWAAAAPPHSPPLERTATAEPNATLSRLETVLAAWETWDGTFVAFADYVRNDLRLPMGRQLIAHILEVTGARLRKKRNGRSPDELALRGAFETFFPGAQWVGDGKEVRVTVGEETFTLNLELNVDAHTGAFVGLSVRDTEDSAAVVECFNDAIATTGDAPLAELLDNKPSNHTADVEAVLASNDTLRIRATPFRPQNKAHVEGAFGLFSQEVPPIALDTHQHSRGIARALLLLVAITWARAVNHRARIDRGGRTRVELYNETPTDEQIAAARTALEARCRKQELARLTSVARERPDVRALLDAHFERLGLIDPERHIRLAISNHPLDAIVDGIAIFDTKRQRGSLPDGADARYLFGIVANVAAKLEGEALSRTLLAVRFEARDQALEALRVAQAAVCLPDKDALEVIIDCVDRTLATERCLDRTFWLRTLADEIRKRAEDRPHRERLFFAAASRINTTFRVPPRERQDALRQLADNFVPLC